MENLYSYLTAISRRTLSLPAKTLYQKGLVIGRVLDYGCGRGADVFLLRVNGVEIEAYDPHYQPIMPLGQFDTILCTYVLNVLLPEEQQAVLEDVRTRLTPSGVAYFTVRRDIQREGWRWYNATKQTYQCNVVLDLPVVKKTHKFCIYKLSENP